MRLPENVATAPADPVGSRTPEASGTRTPWARAGLLAARPVNSDGMVEETPALGLVAFSSPADPEPSLVVRDGRVVELDGRSEEHFDVIDRFVARHAIDLGTAPEAMAMSDQQLARAVVDVSTSRAEVCRLFAAITPAKSAQVLALMTPVELLMGMQKMRARRVPASQAHVTNQLDHPLLLAADAATAVAQGFREIETTVPVLRDAPLNAVALLIGSQVPSWGTLTQCSVEEAAELRLGLRGLTTYAETVSLYGTEAVFVDGDDTPWSKALLASAYASRGLKLRVTSGAGSEALMGETEGRSMMYLEARCVALARAVGAQGVQNGGIDGVSVAAAVPGGMRQVLAENLLVMLSDLESCTGNDTLMSASDLRRAAHTVPLLLAGSDFLFSGFGAIPAYDNMFGPSNLNAEDLDDYLAIQRDWGFDGVLRHRPDEELVALRRQAAAACRDVLADLDLIQFDEDDVEACAVANGSRDLPAPPPGAVTAAAVRADERDLDAIDVISSLHRTGHHVIAERVLRMQRLRTVGDHLQPAAIIDEAGIVRSAVTDPNEYTGPGTGYRPDDVRLREIAQVRAVCTVEQLVPHGALAGVTLRDLAEAAPGTDPDEVVVALSPAFGRGLAITLSGLTVGEALREVLAGIEEQGMRWRVITVRDSTDLGAIGSQGARLAGSGVAIGLQGKGTAILHRAELAPLANLELLSVAPRITRRLYRMLGQNAARHAAGDRPAAVSVPESDEAIGPRYHTQVVASMAIEKRHQRAGAPVNVQVSFDER